MGFADAFLYGYSQNPKNKKMRDSAVCKRERANGKGKGCEVIEEFKRRGGQDAEPYLDVDHDERRWDQ